MTVVRTFNAPLPDMQTVSDAATSSNSTPSPKRCRSASTIRHTFIGDLVITLQAAGRDRGRSGGLA